MGFGDCRGCRTGARGRMGLHRPHRLSRRGGTQTRHRQSQGGAFRRSSRRSLHASGLSDAARQLEQKRILREPGRVPPRHRRSASRGIPQDRGCGGRPPEQVDCQAHTISGGLASCDGGRSRGPAGVWRHPGRYRGSRRSEARPLGGRIRCIRRIEGRKSVKISMFHLMPHRELPPDFETRYESVWVTPPWWELADARRVGQYYNWTIDELLYAAQCGFDGVCTNEHHQNAYGFMPSPNIMGSVLAKLTNGSNVAIVQMGATLPTSNPPIRVAEEYAMLDCISGGRLVAGLPLGSPMDVNFCYGITPMEHRERYREAFALTLKAWQAREIFAWNGRYYQLAEVNLWPRPIQQPHPPVWVPGSGSIST